MNNFFIKCAECGKFLSYKDLEKAIVSVRYASCCELDPPDEEFIHKKCWNKLTEEQKNLHIKTSWQISGTKE